MPLRVDVADGVSRLTIDRPEADNRVDRDTCLQLAEAMRAADADPAVRVVVLTASGDRFCVGGQVDGAADGETMKQVAFAQAFAGVHEAAAGLGKPLVAAINGDAIAGGFSLISAADLAIAVDTARFGLPELAVGAFPMLALATSVSLLPRKVLFDLIYNARLLSAAEALQFGLVSAVVPKEKFNSAVAAQVDRLKRQSPIAVMLGRRAYESMLDMPRMAALSHGGLALIELMATQDGREAVRAHSTGRSPIWSGR
jgi:enoyl-CoA hydratase/carnithine racemase